MFVDFSFKKWILSEGINVALLTGQYRKRFPTATDQQIQAKINLAASADPTPEKKYTNWIFTELLNERIRLPEDQQTVLQQLDLFNKSKQAIKELGKPTDIGQYNRYQLWELLSQIEQTGFVSKRQQVKEIKQKGATPIYKDAKWLIVKMTEPKACAYYARGTKWCTSDPEIAKGYLEEGPLYIIYRNNQVYAQLHIQSGQLMDELDNPITSINVPKDLSDIIEKYIPVKNFEERKSRNEIANIFEKVLPFADGYYWGTQDYNKYVLVSPDTDRQIIVTLTDGRIERISHAPDKTPQALWHKHANMTAIQATYKPINNWNSYILALLTSEFEGKPIVKDLGAIKNTFSEWNLGDLSEEELKQLEEKRPDLIPKPEFITSDGNQWAKEDATYILFTKNFDPVLQMMITSKPSVINSAKWQESTIKSILGGKKELNKSDFSLAITEFILRKNIEHVEYQRLALPREWKFTDLLPEHQQIILQKFPHFNDPIAHAEKYAKGEELVGKLSMLDPYLHLKHVNLNGKDFGLLDNFQDVKTLLLRLIGRDSSIFHNLKTKIEGEYLKDSGYRLEDAVKEKLPYEQIKDNFPFIDEDTYNFLLKLDRNNIYKIKMTLDAAISEKVYEELSDKIYRFLQKYNTEEFQIARKGKTFYFITDLENIKSEFRKNQSYKELRERYFTWQKRLQEVSEEIINQIIKEIPRKMDKEVFKKALTDYDYYGKITSIY